MDTAPLLPLGGTLHVADGLTEPVFGVLGPTTDLLCEVGLPQTLVLIDRREHAHRLLRLAEEVHLELVSPARPRWRHWLALRRAVREQLQLQRPTTVHFHGALAWLSCLGLVREAHVVPPRLNGGTAPPLDVVVDDFFLNAPHQEARKPVVVSGCHHDNRRAVAMFCRAAVIFGAAELDLGFNWCGPVSPTSLAALQAAGIGATAGEMPQELLPHLQSAWVFLAGEGHAERPVRLMQAMGCGLPCLAADTPEHRDLIEDGQTGLLFRSDEEARQLLTLLIDDAGLRLRLGEAARSLARKRFSREQHRASVMALYGQAVRPSAPETAPLGSGLAPQAVREAAG